MPGRAKAMPCHLEPVGRAPPRPCCGLRALRFGPYARSIPSFASLPHVFILHEVPRMTAKKNAIRSLSGA